MNKSKIKNFPAIKQTAEQLYLSLQPYCIAIYLGGSLCEGIVENPHDVDFICFSKTPREMNDLRRGIYQYTKNTSLPESYDFIQVRNIQNEEHAYGSYINKKMIRIIGEELKFDFDVIGKDRQEYIQILQSTVADLCQGKILNQKRWYQIYRGLCILLNDSYEITPEQRQEINVLHDLAPGWESIRDKTIDLVQKLK